MSERPESMEAWIPFYAGGTLSQAERAAFEAALAEHPEWHAAIDDARALYALSDGLRVEETLTEVHPDLLTAYAEEPETLGESTRTWIEQRVATDPTTREALNALLRAGHALEPAAAIADATPLPANLASSAESATGLWSRLRSTVLGPLPALGYLLLLVAMPLLWWSQQTGSDPSAFAPTRLTVQGEAQWRDSGRADAPTLRLAPSSGWVLLELATRLQSDDLNAMDVRVELEAEGRVLARQPMAAERFRDVDGFLRLDYLLDSDALRRGVEYRLVLRAQAPGSPVDGQPLFQRALVVGD